MYNYQQQCLHKSMRKVKTFCKSSRKADTKEVRLPACTGQLTGDSLLAKDKSKEAHWRKLHRVGDKDYFKKNMYQQFKKFLFKFLNFKLLSRRHFLIYKLANKVQA